MTRDQMRAARPCKIGTVHALMFVHREDKPTPGLTIRVRSDRTKPWQRVTVTSIDPDGYFFAWPVIALHRRSVSSALRSGWIWLK